MDRLVAVAKIGGGNEMQEVVGTGAANDPVGVESEGAADCIAQRGRGAVGIVGQVFGSRVISRDRAWAWAERRRAPRSRPVCRGLSRARRVAVADAGRRSSARSG